MPIANLTAQSEPINISRENKIEIVSTLTAYPLVLQELELTTQLLNQCNSLNTILNQELSNKELEIILLQSINSKSEEQINLLKKQVKNTKRSSWIVPVLAGLSGGLILGITL